MIEKFGNIFNTEQNHIGHGVNVVGAMGAGIAAQIRTKYPRNYRKYRTACMTRFLKPGGNLMVEDSGMFIHNIASQDNPGPNARYDWLTEGLLAAAYDMSAMGGRMLAVPEIGAGIGGLKWDVVRIIMLGIEADVDDGDLFEVWRYPALIVGAH